MSDRTTQRKGDIGVSQAIATFTRMGWDVSLPLTESAAYDLIVDVEDVLYKVQVRYTTTKDVGLRRIHSNSKGYVVKHPSPKSYDWLYVFKSSGEEFLIKDSWYGKSTIRPKESDKIKMEALS